MKNLLAAGPDALNQQEKLLLLNDAEAIVVAPSPRLAPTQQKIAPWWLEAIRRYGR